MPCGCPEGEPCSCADGTTENLRRVEPYVPGGGHRGQIALPYVPGKVELWQDSEESIVLNGRCSAAGVQWPPSATSDPFDVRLVDGVVHIPARGRSSPICGTNRTTSIKLAPVIPGRSSGSRVAHPVSVGVINWRTRAITSPLFSSPSDTLAVPLFASTASTPSGTDQAEKQDGPGWGESGVQQQVEQIPCCIEPFPVFNFAEEFQCPGALVGDYDPDLPERRPRGPGAELPGGAEFWGPTIDPVKLQDEAGHFVDERGTIDPSRAVWEIYCGFTGPCICTVSQVFSVQNGNDVFLENMRMRLEHILTLDPNYAGRPGRRRPPTGFRRGERVFNGNRYVDPADGWLKCCQRTDGTWVLSVVDAPGSFPPGAKGDLYFETRFNSSTGFPPCTTRTCTVYYILRVRQSPGGGRSRADVVVDNMVCSGVLGTQVVQNLAAQVRGAETTGRPYSDRVVFHGPGVGVRDPSLPRPVPIPQPR
jgi:hypothetical protein